MYPDELLQSIYSYLSTITGLTTILYPNVHSASIPDEYLKINVMPVEPETVGVKSLSMHRGLIQISIVALDGVGEIYPLRYASIILDAFKRGTVISGLDIRIDSEPYASQGFSDGTGHFIIPVTIAYNKLC